MYIHRWLLQALLLASCHDALTAAAGQVSYKKPLLAKRAFDQPARSRLINSGYNFLRAVLNWESNTCQPVVIYSLQNIRDQGYTVDYNPFYSNVFRLFRSFLPEDMVVKKYLVKYISADAITVMTGSPVLVIDVQFFLRTQEILIVNYAKFSLETYTHSFATLAAACAYDAGVGQFVRWKVIDTKPMAYEDQEAFGWLTAQYGITTLGSITTFTPQDADPRGLYALMGISCGTLANSLLWSLNARFAAEERLYITKVDVYKLGPQEEGFSFNDWPDDPRENYAIRYWLQKGRDNIVYDDPNPVA